MRVLVASMALRLPYRTKFRVFFRGSPWGVGRAELYVPVGEDPYGHGGRNLARLPGRGSQQYMVA